MNNKLSRFMVIGIVSFMLLLPLWGSVIWAAYSNRPIVASIAGLISLGMTGFLHEVLRKGAEVEKALVQLELEQINAQLAK